MKKSGKTSIKIFTITLILCLFFVFLLPYFFSSYLGTHTLAFLAKQKGKTLSISSMQLRWFGPQSFKNINFSDANIDLSLSSFRTSIPLWRVLNMKSLAKKSLFTLNAQAQIEKGKISFHLPGYPQTTFEEIELNATTDEKEKTTQISFQAKSFQDNTSGTLSLSGKFQDGEKASNLQDLNGSIQWKFENISTVPLDQLLGLIDPSFRGFLFDLLGNELNFSGTLQLTKTEGPLQVDLSSSRTQLSLPGYITSKELTLTSPFHGKFILPEKYGNYYFSYLLKAFFSEFVPSQAVFFNLAKEGFSLPLTKNPLKGLHISHGVVDLGQGRAKAGSLLHDLFKILELSLLSSSKEVIDVWFSPTGFRMENNTLYFDRTDMLLDKAYQICFWGRLDLDKQFLEVTAGLTASALENAYGISGLPENYVLQVPIRGPFSGPKVHKTSATKKIIAFKATEFAQHSDLPFIGSLIKHLMKEDQSAVPPPVDPLPWGKVEIQQKKQGQRKSPAEDIFKIFKK